MKNLIVHFGIHRTGTTTIQRILQHNIHKLADQGILLPRINNSHDHSSIAWGLFSNKIPIQTLIENIESQILDSTKTILLSHEDFSIIQSESWLRELSEKFHTKAIVYLRRQDLWLESWYNQHIKWPWTAKFSSSTPEFFLENINDFYWINYAELLSKISNVLGKENIHVNVIDSLGIKDTSKDFFSYINTACDIPEKVKDSNASISMAKIEIIRRINLFTLKDNNKAKTKILSVLNEMDIPEDDGSKIAFTDEQVQFVLKNFEESNNFVAKEFFQRETLFGDPFILNRTPCKISDYKAYRVYIPRILKKLACAQ